MENPQPLQPMNSDEQFWTDLGLKYEATFAQDIGLRKVIHTYLDKLPTSASVLDCGSGTGKPVAKAIADSGRHVHGIDMSDGMVSLCRKAVPSGTFELVNMLDYTPTVSYNGIVASLSIFELSRQELNTMSQKWFQWLKPGGLLLINTFDAEDSPQVKAENYDADAQCATKVQWAFMGNSVLITLFTKVGWKAVLEKAGFEIVYTEKDLFIPPADAKCDPEPRYYIIAQRKASS